MFPFLRSLIALEMLSCRFEGMPFRLDNYIVANMILNLEGYECKIYHLHKTYTRSAQKHTAIK